MRSLTRLSIALPMAGLLLLVHPAHDRAPILLGGSSPALADDDGGGGGGAGRSRGSGRLGGRNEVGRKHRPIDLFNFSPFRFNAPRSRGSARGPRVQASSLPDHAPSELVAAGLSDADISTLASDGYTVLDRQTLASGARIIVRLRVPRGTSLEAARVRLAALNAQAEVDFNHYYRPQQEATACAGRNCAFLELVAWPRVVGNSCANLPLIGMIDTGINLEHPALRGRGIEVLKLAADRPSSDRQHGTAVAALLVGDGGSRAPGLLPNGRLIAVDGFRTDQGSDSRMEAFDLVRGLDLLLARQVQVLNLSFTGAENALLSVAVADARRRGMVMVAAAGNAGPRAKPLYPAAYEGVIAVTALDDRMGIYRRAAQGDHIDLAAPGVNIWSAASVSGWRPKTGTSFAAPFVTAVAALMLARDRESRADDIVDELSRTARDLGSPGRDPVFGWGLVQASTRCPS